MRPIIRSLFIKSELSVTNSISENIQGLTVENVCCVLVKIPETPILSSHCQNESPVLVGGSWWEK